MLCNSLKEIVSENIDLKSEFKKDHKRVENFSLAYESIFFDYSKNLINKIIFDRLIKLANSSNLKQKISQMFAGEKINVTENRSVLHTALRDLSDKQLIVDDQNIHLEIYQEKQRVKSLIEKVTSGKWKGYSGKKITDIINIGIGGSDLGPKMVVRALVPYHCTGLKVHFVSNVDADSLLQALNCVHPETTLFIIASKSFSTEETLLNSISAREWLLNHYKEKESVANHFVAISSQLDKVKEFGIDLEHCYKMWDWVGGRYSLWSSIGMPIAFAVGYDNFEKLLAGAYSIDKHFKEADFAKNIPVIMALLASYYSCVYNSQTQALLPYDDRLSFFVDYLQQADMESNGKSVDLAGNTVNYQTGSILWGGVGTNGQHAFHQLLHQGNVFVPVDFIAIAKSYHSYDNHQESLLANCFAQSQALMFGQSYNIVYNELLESGVDEYKSKSLAYHKVIPGNRPSTTILLEELNPYNLGALIALYEHKIFVQGVLWDINSYDQWGVELGKKLGKNILKAMRNLNSTEYLQLDESTKKLIQKSKF
ncbi:glucose-6-phosphate isomerase [Allofrancisella guangzhouensis]|uniref:Glucose-6-phosphate isomerase n=1 Tax=Allofrancisella guangzhouensis TaxID=594679 RepID=A0A0A8E4T0_9GAMM|nr:glucose-6-phosphate isomerase [Allofrancisella guangzhouensis]AJC49245.1 glucose-6-phosphate isomerase [Allofrancisella guangzhouensis]MBK2027687.1 glucose-6-phosphate isomerase [Allofrancisella guangzhouensis]MBK2044899.1 glucose-6-phosphate isomerase [Allofrancisella guangzhouensis]MBK2046424.1 glucose-6-phosphate isomerase [Allofrancisella guangzhouensis]